LVKKFAADKVFTEKEIEDALAEPLTATRNTVPHFAKHLSNKLYNKGGYYYKTHLDLNTQLKTEKIVEDYIRAQRLRSINNGAVVIIDNKTHNVISLCGFCEF
jgi:Membrane carboxypeptidase/penicillin-binding protein PbpC